jgi:hypothetical protein
MPAIRASAAKSAAAPSRSGSGSCFAGVAAGAGRALIPESRSAAVLVKAPRSGWTSCSAGCAEARHAWLSVAALDASASGDMHSAPPAAVTSKHSNSGKAELRIQVDSRSSGLRGPQFTCPVHVCFPPSSLGLDLFRSRSIFFSVVSALADPSPDRLDLGRRSVAPRSASLDRSLFGSCVRSDPERIMGLVIGPFMRLLRPSLRRWFGAAGVGPFYARALARQ